MNSKQLTILTGSAAGNLSHIVGLLSEEGIDIRAHCLVDNGDGNAKLRMIVSDADRAVDLLRGNQTAVVLNDVVVVETDDKPGGLSRLLDVFKTEDIAVEYTYTAASATPGVAVMVFRFSDNEKAETIMQNNAFSFAPEG